MTDPCVVAAHLETHPDVHCADGVPAAESPVGGPMVDALLEAAVPGFPTDALPEAHSAHVETVGYRGLHQQVWVYLP